MSVVMPATLDQLNKGQTGQVIDISGESSVTQRILALGVLPGQRLTVTGVAPMGDPITVEGPNGRVSLRRTEAAAIRIEHGT